MAFVKEYGGKKAYRAVFEIRSKGATPAARRKELARFRAELKKLAKKFHGRVK